MSAYVRPFIPAQAWADADGAPIAYGNRWQNDSPPEDSYSRTSNLERFAPLHDVADALIAWLAETFDVVVEDDATAAGDFRFPPEEPVRAVRLTPTDALAAPLTVVYTDFPGLRVAAGVLHEEAFPDCGCDACDDAILPVADELEGFVFSVVAGRFAEGIHRSASESLRYAVDDSGARGGDGPARGDVDPQRWARAQERLRQLTAAGGEQLARIGHRESGTLTAWRPWAERG